MCVVGMCGYHIMLHMDRVWLRTDKGKGQYDEEVNVEVLEVTKYGLNLKMNM